MCSATACPLAAPFAVFCGYLLVSLLEITAAQRSKARACQAFICVVRAVRGAAHFFISSVNARVIAAAAGGQERVDVAAADGVRCRGQRRR